MAEVDIHSIHRIPIKHPILETIPYFSSCEYIEGNADISLNTIMLLLTYIDTGRIMRAYLTDNSINELKNIGYKLSIIDDIKLLDIDTLYDIKYISKREYITRKLESIMCKKCSSITVLDNFIMTGSRKYLEDDVIIPGHCGVVIKDILITRYDVYYDIIKELASIYDSNWCSLINMIIEVNDVEMLTAFLTIHGNLKLVIGGYISQFNDDMFNKILDITYQIGNFDYILMLFNRWHKYDTNKLHIMAIKIHNVSPNVSRFSIPLFNNYLLENIRNESVYDLFRLPEFCSLDWDSKFIQSLYLRGKYDTVNVLFDYIKDIDSLSIDVFTNKYECVSKMNQLIRHPLFNPMLISNKTTSKTTILMYLLKNKFGNDDDILKYIIKNTAVDINYLNSTGFSLLTFACKYGTPTAINIILDVPGVNINGDPDRFSPLDYTIKNNVNGLHKDTIDRFLGHSDIYITSYAKPYVDKLT